MNLGLSENQGAIVTTKKYYYLKNIPYKVRIITKMYKNKRELIFLLLIYEVLSYVLQVRDDILFSLQIYDIEYLEALICR